MKKPDYKQLDTESFQGSLGEYKVITTDDSSRTLWSEKFDECCHCTEGAVNETIHNYIDGTKLIETSKKHSPIAVFEIGFALGLGVNLTFEKLAESSNTPCIFVSCEIDSLLAEWSIKNNNQTFENYPSFSELKKIQQNGLVYYEAKKAGSTLVILIGDARETIPKALCEEILPATFNCFYQDAFSPLKNPSLWTVEWFRLMYFLASPTATLATYSSSTPVRKAMIEAGWGVSNRKGFQNKKNATTAFANRTTDAEIISKLNSSPLDSLRDTHEK